LLEDIVILAGATFIGFLLLLFSLLAFMLTQD
jgi:hypothetical protein